MTSYNLLVFDDDELIRELYDAVLTGKGHAVFAYKSPEQFLALSDHQARLAASDALVTDGDMPGMHGLDLARKLRTELNYTKPIIYNSGNMTEREASELERETIALKDNRQILFVNKALVKPVTGSKLLEAIAQEIARQKQ